MRSEDARSELTGRLGPSLRKGRRDDVGRAVGKGKKPGVARPAGAPYWLPRGPFWDRLSEGVKRAAGEVLEPAYRRLVLEARDELERSAGITLVHLMWLEICDQTAMSEVVGNRDEIDAILKNAEESVGRHLHLVAAKNSTAELLLKLRMVRATIQREQQVTGPPEAAPALPAPDALLPHSPTPRSEAPLRNAFSGSSASPRAKQSFAEVGSQAELGNQDNQDNGGNRDTTEARVMRFIGPRFVEDRESTALLAYPAPVSEQPASANPTVGPELCSPPELSCATEEPAIGKTTG